ncbi:MAG: DUF6174 domain-containing protein [Gemmatimonadetes bacterium]|nr:DUF6174 domain-containing protein [Gemmatimonadota bacterium]
MAASGWAVMAGVKALARRAARRPLRAGWIVVALTAVGCSSPLGPEQDDLSAARARWASLSPDRYTFVLQRSCFCPPETVRPMRIEVLGSIVNEAVYSDTEEPVAIPLEQVPTIDDLFDEIQGAIDDDAFLVDATYDPDRGFPTSVSIDHIELAVDDEQAFTVTAFQFVDTTTS